MRCEVKTDGVICLNGKSPNKMQHVNSIPAYQATLVYQDFEENEYHQSITRKQGTKTFYIEAPILKK